MSFRPWKVQATAGRDRGWPETMWTTWKAQMLWQVKCKLVGKRVGKRDLAFGDRERKQVLG